MMTPYTIKWGIMATGGIAETFCKDLLTDPLTRNVNDIRHEIVAVSSSISVDRAASFIKKIDGPAGAKAYGSYADLVADPNVDIIYIATPHSHHFQNAMLALEACKNVLCEKALTINAFQAKKLINKAKEKNLFFMEAVWTRFLPLSIKVRELLSSGEIGTVYRTLADLSFNVNSLADDGTINFPDTHRIVNMDLAGGATLDLGIYALTWIFQSLYHINGNSGTPRIVAAMNHYHTGADENTSIIVQFPKSKAMGVATTCLLVGSNPQKAQQSHSPAPIRIQGSTGEIQVSGPAYRPLSFSVTKWEGGTPHVFDYPIPTDPKRGNWGHGMFWEADECARCLRDGKKQSKTMPWSESLIIMETMEEALKQGGVNYPDPITTDVYNPKSPLNTGNK